MAWKKLNVCGSFLLTRVDIWSVFSGYVAHKHHLPRFTKQRWFRPICGAKHLFTSPFTLHPSSDFSSTIHPIYFIFLPCSLQSSFTPSLSQLPLFTHSQGAHFSVLWMAVSVPRSPFALFWLSLWQYSHTVLLITSTVHLSVQSSVSDQCSYPQVLFLLKKHKVKAFSSNIQKRQLLTYVM